MAKRRAGAGAVGEEGKHACEATHLDGCNGERRGERDLEEARHCRSAGRIICEVPPEEEGK